jgi:hypothetical protein
VILVVVLITVTCVRETLYQLLESNLNNYLVLLTYWYQALVRDTLGLIWYLLCHLLQRTAQHLAASFQQVWVNCNTQGTPLAKSCILGRFYFAANARLKVIRIVKMVSKKNLNFALEQATKAQRGTRCIALLFL